MILKITIIKVKNIYIKQFIREMNDLKKIKNFNALPL